MKAVRIWVAPEFQVMTKVEAAKNGQSIIEYTKSLASSQKSLIQINEEVKPVEKKKFTFRL